jgi:hypothetical protein
MKKKKAVGEWLEIYDNPMNAAVRRVRETILHADPRIKESMQGDAPAFTYRGTFATIFPESRKHVSLMVERGAEIPGHHRRLEGSGDTGRVMKIRDVADAHAVKHDLQHLVRAWCDWRDADAADSSETTVRAAKKPAAKNAKKKTAPRRKTARTAAKKAPARRARRPADKKPAAKKASPRRRAGRPAAKKSSRRSATRSRSR